MYSFIKEEHRETYNVFYKEITGKKLKTVVLSGPSASGLKRKAPAGDSTRPKEEPRLKKQKADKKVRVECIAKILELFVTLCSA